MSTDTLGLEKVVSIENKLNVEETFRPKEVIAKGGVNRSIFAMMADSYSDQILVWNSITPPSLTTVVERSLRVRYQLQVVSTYTTAGAAYPTVPYFPAAQANGTVYQEYCSGCLAPFPLSRSSSSIEVRINGNATSVSSNDYQCIFPHILTKEELNRYCPFPCQPDDAPLNYNWASANGVPQNSRSPFATYGSNTSVPSRASYLGTLVSSQVVGNNTVDTYLFDITEQLIVSPFMFGEGLDAMGLANVNNLTLNVRIADINRAISVMPSAVGAVTVSLQATGFRPQLLLEYTTQDPILATRQPEQLIYNYELVQPFISPLPAQLNNASANIAGFASQAIRLSSIPEKLYIFARPSKGALNTNALSQQIPDSFLRITGLRMNWNNRVGIFSTYTEQDLYKMSVSNGLQDTFYDWKLNSGSICVVDVTKDICLEPDQVSGASNQYSTLQVYADLAMTPLAYWAQTTALNYDFYVVVVQNGKAVISPSACDFLLTGPNGEDVINATSRTDLKVDDTTLKALGKSSGGSIFGGIGKLLHKGLNVAHTVSKHLKPEHIDTAKDALKSLGIGGAVAGGKMKGKHKRTY